jgi:uncharacterized protein
MDLLWLIVGLILMVIGLVGCILPLLPGPPVSYIGLLVLQFRSDSYFSLDFLLLWAGITILVTILDYIIPLYGTKKFGGTRYGIWGCMAGLVAGLFFPPVGLIAGPLIGAFIGEMIASSNTDQALRAALGSFLGFLAGTLLKVMACIAMFYYFIKAI